MKKILLIRSNPVNPDPPVEKIANTLIKQGFEVTVLAWEREANYSCSKTQLQLSSGVCKIISFGIKASFGGGIKKNLLPILRFQIQLFKWMKLHHEEIDCIHAFDFDTGLISSKIAKRYNIKFVYHILDYYSASHILIGGLKGIIERVENSIINNADATIICSEKRVEQIRLSHPRKLIIIHNTPDKSGMITDSIISKKSKSQSIKIVYVGILAEARMIREVADIVAKDKRLELHIGGFGNIEETIKELCNQYENLFYYGKLKYNDALSLENSCDIMFAIYSPEIDNHKYSAPSKFYESLMLGKPIIMAKGTGFDEVLEQEEIGELVEYSYMGVRQGIQKLIDNKNRWPDMAEKAKSLYDSKYSWSIMENRIIELYSELIL